MRDLGYRYQLNNEKTRYGNIKGKNFNLGLMLNGDHNITIGHEAKRRLKVDLHNLIMDYRKIGNDALDINWIIALEGRLNYYRHVEPGGIKQIETRVLEKHRCWWYSIDSMIKIAKINANARPLFL